MSTSACHTDKAIDIIIDNIQHNIVGHIHTGALACHQGSSSEGACTMTTGFGPGEREREKGGRREAGREE